MGVFDLLGFPALVDQGDSVGVRLFDTRARARHEGHAGLRRFLNLHLGKELKAIREKSAGYRPAQAPLCFGGRPFTRSLLFT